MNTMKGSQFIVGNADATISHWDTFVSKEACLTGAHGLTFNSSIISLGLVFDPEVKPDGRVYPLKEEPKPAPVPAPAPEPKKPDEETKPEKQPEKEPQP